MPNEYCKAFGVTISNFRTSDLSVASGGQASDLITPSSMHYILIQIRGISPANVSIKSLDVLNRGIYDMTIPVPCPPLIGPSSIFPLSACVAFVAFRCVSPSDHRAARLIESRRAVAEACSRLLHYRMRESGRRTVRVGRCWTERRRGVGGGWLCARGAVLGILAGAERWRCKGLGWVRTVRCYSRYHVGALAKTRRAFLFCFLVVWSL